MRMYYRCCILFLTFCLACHLSAQDALFSQIHRARNLLNPALLSIQNNTLEVDINYREQGASMTSGLPIRTFQVLANYSRRTFKVDRMTYGLSILNDRGGPGHVGGVLMQGHFAYLKKLSGKYSKIGAHYLGIGLSAGGGQRSVDADNFWFGNQYNKEFNFVDEGRDPRELALLQGSTLQSPLYSNIDAGITWYANISDEFSAHGGLGLFHLNGSNISLIEGQRERQKVRYAIHFGTSNKLTDLVSMLPRIQYIRQASSSILTIGTEFATENGDLNEFAMKFGFFVRGNSGINGPSLDALIATMNLNYNQFQFGLAYDITISRLARYNSGRGGWELRMGYRFNNNSKSNRSKEVSTFRIN